MPDVAPLIAEQEQALADLEADIEQYREDWAVERADCERRAKAIIDEATARAAAIIKAAEDRAADIAAAE